MAVSLAGQKLETTTNECGIAASCYVYPSWVRTKQKEERLTPTADTSDFSEVLEHPEEGTH